MATSSASSAHNQADLTAQSLFIVFKQLPEQTQQAFIGLLKKTKQDYANEDWTAFSQSSLDAIWNTPEEDYWDNLYVKHHAR